MPYLSASAVVNGDSLRRGAISSVWTFVHNVYRVTTCRGISWRPPAYSLLVQHSFTNSRLTLTVSPMFEHLLNQGRRQDFFSTEAKEREQSRERV